ncbi:MAG: CsbD family protein [Bdellovibrionaceae bacterium]|nr:CsbD family protein [Pseudobdellovibrionaceae bacterium]
MDKNIFEGKWHEFKGEIRKAWGNITGDELESTKGDVESISGLIQQKYGHSKDEVSKKLTEMKNRFAESTKSSLREGHPTDKLN